MSAFYGHQASKGKEAQLRDIESIYSAWKQKYLVARSDVSSVQKFVWYQKDERFESWTSDKQAVTVSEAHGYGMLAIVMMDVANPGFDAQAQQDFDAMVRYFKAFPSQIDNRLMAWQQWTDGINKTTGAGQITNVYNTPNGADSAIDGDLDIAYALLVAAKHWGNQGEFDYANMALSVMNGLAAKTVHPNDHVLLLGDWVNIHDGKYGKSTRTSDFMLQHLRSFAQADQANSTVWLQVLAKTAAIYEQNVQSWSQQTGLVADFVTRNNQGDYEPTAKGFLEGDHDGDYYYNAARVPWRLGMDYLYNGETQVKDELVLLNNWIKNQSGGKVANIYPGYVVSTGVVGTAIETSYTDLTFIAPFAVSAVLADDNQEFIDTLWATLANNNVEQEYYFGNSIRLLSMFAASGYWAVP